MNTIVTYIAMDPLGFVLGSALAIGTVWGWYALVVRPTIAARRFRRIERRTR